MKFDYFAIGGLTLGKSVEGKSSTSTVLKRGLIKNIVTKYKDKKFHIFALKLTTLPDLLANYSNIVSID